MSDEYKKLCKERGILSLGLNLQSSWKAKKKKIKIVEDNLIFNSVTECAEHLGVCKSCVSQAAKGIINKLKKKTIIYYEDN